MLSPVRNKSSFSIKRNLIAVAISAIVLPAHASVDLIAIGSVSGSASDLSGQSGALENGVAGNLLGGVGSGLAWAGGNTFIATPDRGPNAISYNSALDDTTSYISRFQTFTMSLTASSSGSLPFTLTPTLTKTTLISSATALNYGSGGVPALNATNNTQYFTGRSDGFGTGLSTNPNNARLDTEGVRVSNDGKSVFVSDEYGPYIYQIDRATGQRIKSFTLPANLAIANLSAVGATEIANNTTGRITNKGMEGLAITPDGKTLVGIMQANLEQDKKGSLRIVTVNIADGTTHEYAYQLTTGSGVSEIVAINDHQFLVDERDGKGLASNGATAPGDAAGVKQLNLIDLTGAQDVTNLSGDLSSKAVAKTSFLDIKAVLVSFGIDANNIPSKLEGLAFGEDIVVNGVTKHTLYVANDNDFLATVTNGLGQAVANDNNFYVFAFTDADLGQNTTFQAQQISSVPLPTSAYLFGSALLGLFARNRRKSI